MDGNWYNPELNAYQVPLEGGQAPVKKNRLQFKEGYIALEKREMDQLEYDFYSNKLTAPRSHAQQPPKTQYTVYLQVRLAHLVGFNQFGRRETATIYSNIVPLTIDLTRFVTPETRSIKSKLSTLIPERAIISVKRNAEPQGGAEEQPPTKRIKFEL